MPAVTHLESHDQRDRIDASAHYLLSVASIARRTEDKMEPSQFITAALLIPLVVAVVCGCAGGIARAFGSATPEGSSRGAFLLKSALVGAVAAVAGFYVLEPETPLRFVAAALISGYSGPALLDALDARFRVLAAEARANAALAAGRAAIDKADSTLRRLGPQPNATPIALAPGDPVAVALAELDAPRARLNALALEPSR